MGSDAALRCLPECGCLGGRGKPRCVTRCATDGGSSADGGGGDRSTIERRPSTHVGELFSPRPSETSHSPARLVPSGGPVFAPATENARYHNLPEAHYKQGDHHLARNSRMGRRVRTACDKLDPGLLGHAHAKLELREGEVHAEPSSSGAAAAGTASLHHRDGVDEVVASEEHLVRPRARRKGLIALSKTHKQCVIRHRDARETSVRDAQRVQRKRSVQYGEHECVRVAAGYSVVVRLDGCSSDCGGGKYRCRCGCGALQDRPVDGEVALNEGFLEDRGEAEAVRGAVLGAVPEEGEPFVLGGTCL